MLLEISLLDIYDISINSLLSIFFYCNTMSEKERERERDSSSLILLLSAVRHKCRETNVKCKARV